MLLTDRIDSPGLLVRPRPGRTELCGEFTENESLAAAAAFVAGTTRACAAAVRRPGARTALPPRLDVELTPAVHRYGWYVDRRAFGADLHAASRRALLRRASGGTIRAQSHLELAWAAARQALAEDAAASDLHAADAMITGSLPLPAEQRQPDQAHGQPGGDAQPPPGGTIVRDTPRLGVHVRPGFTLRPVTATWDFTVFEASGPARSAYACIPRDSLPGFMAALEQGALDDPIAAYLALTARRRVLSAPGQTRRAGLYDQMGAPAGLLAPERDPQTGRHEAGAPGAKRTLARPGKQHRQDRETPRKEQEAPAKEQKAPGKEQEAPRRARRFLPRAAAIGAVAAVVLAGVGLAIAMVGRANSPAMVSLRPAAVVFPADRVSTTVTRSLTMTNNGGTPATITGISISGPGRKDFSVLGSDFLAAYRGSQAVPAASPPPCHRRVPAGQTCMITVAFTALAPGSHTADLRIDLASPLRPQDIALSGAGTITPPPPSSSVHVTGVSPASGTTAGGTSVTITGTGFTAPPADTGVSFGSVAAQFTIDSGTQITATSPPGTGTVHVTVTTPAGTSAGTAAGQFTYTQTATTTALTSSVNPSTAGQPVTFTAAVSPASATGTVTFSDGGTQIGTATLDSSGTATITTTTPLAAGTHMITASYGGDQNFAASTGSLTQTVNKTTTQTATTTALTSSVNPSTAGQPVTFTAAVSPASATGTVTFSDGGTQIGTATLDSSGTATITTTTPLAAGTHMITASYGGDQNFAASTGSLTQTVNKTTTQTATTTALTSSVNPSTAGQPVTFTAAVSPASATGTVTFSDGGTQIGTATLDSSGTATITTTTPLAAGTHMITASYGGDQNFAASTGSLTQTVNKTTTQTATTTALTSSVNPSTAGQPVTFTAAVSPASATGTVTFSDGGTQIGTATLDSSGTATITTTTPLAAGTHMITASYGGDQNFAASTGSLTQTVNKIATTTALVLTSAGRSAPGQWELTATVSPASGTATPTGTVTFSDGGTQLGTATLDSNGTATITTTTSQLAGGAQITASYGGDQNFAASTGSLPVIG